MKRILTLTLAGGLILGALSLPAGPLDRAQVSAGAKWLLHLDVDALRKTQLGDFIFKSAIAEAGADLKEDAGIDLAAVLAGTTSVMAYGTDYKSGTEGKGVLIWQGSKEIEQIASGFLVQQSEAAKAGEGSVKVVRAGEKAVYAFGEDMHVTVRPGGGLILGRSVEQIDVATSVLDGKSSSLKGKETFADYAELPGSFFFMALAEGFNENADIPPQANVLKLTEGGRIALGEAEGKLRIQLTLKAKTSDVTAQIQQVVQGILAIATLAQSENPDVQQLIRDTKVNTSDRQISLELAVPIEEALKQIEEHHGGGKKTAAAEENEQEQ